MCRISVADANPYFLQSNSFVARIKLSDGIFPYRNLSNQLFYLLSFTHLKPVCSKPVSGLLFMRLDTR